MKKIFCFVLALVLCLSAVVTAGATESQPSERYKPIFEKYILENCKEVEEGLCDYEEVYYHYENMTDNTEATPDYVLARALANEGRPRENDVRIGDYYVHTGCIETPSLAGHLVYVPKDEKVYLLEEVFDVGIDGIEKGFESLGISCALMGDAHRDFELNIKDATALQKYIAGMDVPWDCNVWEYYVFDYNGDEDVDIKDATAIQKRLAGLEG